MATAITEHLAKTAQDGGDKEKSQLAQHSHHLLDTMVTRSIQLYAQRLKRLQSGLVTILRSHQKIAEATEDTETADRIERILRNKK